VAGALALLFLVVPLVELAVILQVGSVIGALNTVALLLVLSLTGGWLMRREGLGVVRRVQSALDEGRVPGAELVDGLLVVIGGALMLTPGFVTDVVGLALLVPPVRGVLRRRLARRLTARALDRRPGPGRGHGGYIDV
jgi:UPF0716 protein FxsA